MADTGTSLGFIILIDNHNAHLRPFRFGVSVLVAGGAGHQPHHDGLEVLPPGLVLIVQSLQGWLPVCLSRH